MLALRSLVCLFVLGCFVSANDSWTALTEKQARRVLNEARVSGQVGGSWDLRVTSTDRSYNYKLRATWITPQVAAAAARLLMIAKGRSRHEAEVFLETLGRNVGNYVLVEIDPREGSGVIPKDWMARFGVPGDDDRKTLGQIVADEDVWKELRGVFPRDYAYDFFLLRFPPLTEEGTAQLRAGDAPAELIVRIYNKVGRVRWAPRPGALNK